MSFQGGASPPRSRGCTAGGAETSGPTAPLDVWGDGRSTRASSARQDDPRAWNSKKSYLRSPHKAQLPSPGYNDLNGVFPTRGGRHGSVSR